MLSQVDLLGHLTYKEKYDLSKRLVQGDKIMTVCVHHGYVIIK